MRVLIGLSSEQRPGGATDLLLDADPDTTIGQLQAELVGGGYAGHAADEWTPRLWRAGTALDAHARLGDVGIYDGDLLHLGERPGPVARPNAGVARAVVISGPDTGVSAPLAPGGVVSVGRRADLRFADAQASRTHAELRAGIDGIITVTDLGSSHGTRLDGVRLDTRTPIPVGAGQLIGVGRNLIALTRQPEAEALIAADPAAGEKSYRRPPRLQPAPVEPVSVELPAKPPPVERRKIPVVALVVPLALGGAMAVLMHQPAYLLFTLMSPIMLVSNVVSDQLTGARAGRRAHADYQRTVADAATTLQQALLAEQAARRLYAPDPAAITTIAAGPSRQLWERAIRDDDFLTLRVGTATVNSHVQLRPSPDQPLSTQPLPAAPVQVNLGDVGVLAVTGPRGHSRLAAAAVLAQIAVLHSPADVHLVMLTGDDDMSAAAWSWTRWLPHLRAAGSFAVGATEPSARARLGELAALIKARQHAGAQRRHIAAVVVLIDDTARLRQLPGMAELLRAGPDVGVFSICRDDDDRIAPHESGAIVLLDPASPWQGRLRLPAGDNIDIDVEGLAAADATDLARTLAPIRDAGLSHSGDALPASVRLLDLLHLNPPDPDQIAFAWDTTPRSTAALVGVDAAGPFTLDLVADGPHALVAGTTGAGKSAFLQTWVTALAAANRPDALNFVLVDYKGESTFAACAHFPHVVGVVSDLDESLAARALESLAAEIRRRERVLRDVGAPHLEAYLAAGQPAGPMPRMVLVIDEFAALLAELPNFVHGLVDIAQRGRSLGVHLVLATQKPGTAVSADIRANTNLRIALRVQEPGDSIEVIGVGDAAVLPVRPVGRALARTGPGGVHAFHVAHITAPATPANGRNSLAVQPVGWASLGRAAEQHGHRNTHHGPTDLDLFAAAALAAAQACGIPTQPSPWVAPLPTELPAADLTPPLPTTRGSTPAFSVPFARIDRPAAQRQEVLCLDLEPGTHLAVAGAPGSGRSTVLRAIAIGLAQTAATTDVHLYGIDCGTGQLLALAKLPHCGAVVSRTETDRLDRLLAFLTDEVAARRRTLAAGGFATLGEQRAATPPGERLPYMVVLLDRWEGWLTSVDLIDNGRLTATFFDLLGEGLPVGLRFVVAGDRQVLFGKLATHTADKLLLRLADRSDARLAGLGRDLPEKMPPGRGLWAADRCEAQVAFVGKDPAPAAQADAVAAIATDLLAAAAHPDARPVNTAPVRVEPLPTLISPSDAAMLPVVGERVGPLVVPAGVGGAPLALHTVDLAVDGPGFVVAGPNKSGRSTALAGMATAALAAGTSVAVFAPRPSPLRGLAGQPGVVGVWTAAEPDPLPTAELLNAVSGPLLVLIDDAELLAATDIAQLLALVVRDGRDMGHGLIAAANATDVMRIMRGFLLDARKSRTGLLLCPPEATFGEMFGARLPRSAAFNGPPGRGLLFRGGQPVVVQVATAEKS